jgi:hypothetical protein
MAVGNSGWVRWALAASLAAAVAGCAESRRSAGGCDLRFRTGTQLVATLGAPEGFVGAPGPACLDAAPVTITGGPAALRIIDLGSDPAAAALLPDLDPKPLVASGWN